MHDNLCCISNGIAILLKKKRVLLHVVCCSLCALKFYRWFYVCTRRFLFTYCCSNMGSTHPHLRKMSSFVISFSRLITICIQQAKARSFSASEADTANCVWLNWNDCFLKIVLIVMVSLTWLYIWTPSVRICKGFIFCVANEMRFWGYFGGGGKVSF